MKTKINIEIKLKDGKTLKLDYEDGQQLYKELAKLYEKTVVKEFIPYCPPIYTEPARPVNPLNPFDPYYPYTTTGGSTIIAEKDGFTMSYNCDKSSIS